MSRLSCVPLLFLLTLAPVRAEEPQVAPAAEQVADKIRQLGCHEVLLPESFFVSSKEGPLIEGELERAVEWVRAASEILGFPAPTASLSRHAWHPPDRK